MPIHTGSDANGTYYQYGNRGKKYYYNSNNSNEEEEAYQKAVRQAIAIHASGYREKK